MRIYRHTQGGTLMLWILGGSAALVGGFVLMPIESRVVVGAVVAALLFSMLLFASLTVEVTTTEVSFAFGPGLIRRRYPVAEIANARAVRNPWYYGWGIHLTPHGWLFNVHGFEAVEIEFKNARKVRIGTDEPGRLVMAIHQAMGSH